MKFEKLAKCKLEFPIWVDIFWQIKMSRLSDFLSD